VPPSGSCWMTAMSSGPAGSWWPAADPRAHGRPGVRWVRLVTDVPNAVVDMWVRRLRPCDYLLSLRGVDTEAVVSVRDPLPGMYELVLLPYLFFKRGL
jgi:D-aspartate ligase